MLDRAAKNVPLAPMTSSPRVERLLDRSVGRGLEILPSFEWEYLALRGP